MATYSVTAQVELDLGIDSRGRMTFAAGEAQGNYRDADSSLVGYELYRGVDAEPDLDGSPWETFSSLPHTTAALAAGHTYYFVLRYRNAYDLVSQNVASWRLELDASGNEVNRPSGPARVSVEPATAGAVNVQADYYYLEDGDYAATKFLIYLTSDGSDPDPATDTPTEVDMIKVDGVARLDWMSGTFADGSTIKVLVRTRRVDAGPVNVDSTDTTIYSTTADADGPAAPDATLHFEEEAEQA